MAIELTSGANASSLLSIRPPAYDSGATARPISTSRPSTATMLPGWIISPNGIASRIMIVAWNIRTTTSRSDRPSSIETRLIGVTRIRSTTPLRSSAMRPKPPNAVPKMAIWMIRPGTNQLNAFVPAPACLTAPSSSGPNRTR